jgi:hypothetical protein
VIDLNDPVHRRIAPPISIELLPTTALRELLSAVSVMIHTPPGARQMISEPLMFQTLGQALGLRRLATEHAAAVVGVYADILHENALARWRDWTPSVLLPMDETLWPRGAGYTEYLAAHASQKPPLPPVKNDQWVAWAWNSVCRYADEVSAEYLVQVSSARKSIEPGLVRGETRDAVAALARHVAPLLLDGDLAAILDQECAWFLRWRHDRGFCERALEMAPT